jgi:hypothetical protein
MREMAERFGTKANGGLNAQHGGVGGVDVLPERTRCCDAVTAVEVIGAGDAAEMQPVRHTLVQSRSLRPRQSHAEKQVPALAAHH